MPRREEEQERPAIGSSHVRAEGGRYRAAIAAGNSEHSLVVRRLLGLDGEDQMPKDKDPLAPAQIGLIRRWIDQGAVWPENADASVASLGPDAKAQPNTGPIARRFGPPSRPSATLSGHERQSTGSSSPGSTLSGCSPPPKPHSTRSYAVCRSI